MIVHEYETIYVLAPDLGEDVHKPLLTKLSDIIESDAGQVVDVDDWGKRKLAYPIRRHSRGHYVRLNFVAPAATVSELERNLRITDQLLRFLTVRIGEDVDQEATAAKAAEAVAKREAAAEAAAAASGPAPAAAAPAPAPAPAAAAAPAPAAAAAATPSTPTPSA